MCPGGDGGAPVDAAPDRSMSVDVSTPDVAADAPVPDVPVDAAVDAPIDAMPDKMPTDMGPPPAVTVPNGLFGFELPPVTGTTMPDWSSKEATLQRDTVVRSQGVASTAFTVPAGGLVTMTSRLFVTNEVTSVTGSIGLDMFVAETQVTASPSTQMWFDCPTASVNGVYVERKSLGMLKVGGWSFLEFKLPPVVQAALTARGNVCMVWFEHRGNGLFRYDKMGFIQ
jgi:hypothetical protein